MPIFIDLLLQIVNDNVDEILQVFTNNRFSNISCSHVYGNETILIKPFITLYTLMWLLSCVSSYVW